MHSSVVLGATGLVGRALTGLLIKEGAPVTALVRRPSGLSAPNLTERVVDFSRLESVSPYLKGDDLYCCLGTTIGKAGSREAFRAVDYELPLALAARAAENGVKRLFLVSSSGADAGSRNFYLKVKGELEEAVAKLPFEAVHIARPSLLLGERKESRPFESLAQSVLPLLAALIPARYKPIAGTIVARAMLALAKREDRGVLIHENERLRALG